MANVMEVYQLLPKTNCKECGYPTCMAFAMQTGGIGTAARFQAAQSIGTLADIAGAVGARFAFFVVSEISRAQREKWDLLLERDGAHPGWGAPV